MEKTIIKQNKVCEMLGISHTTLCKLADSGKLAHVRYGHMRRYTLEDVQEFINSHTKSADSVKQDAA